jgi:hypothetical protein
MFGRDFNGAPRLQPDIWMSAGAYPSFDGAGKFIGFAGTANAVKGSSRRLPSASLGETPARRACIEPTTIEKIADHLLAARALLEAVDDKRLTDALDRTLLITGFRLAEQSGGR